MLGKKVRAVSYEEPDASSKHEEMPDQMVMRYLPDAVEDDP